ncbi:hypothetical protein QO058_26555 [Bosea vestrisii]|uniref:hypothetical protein n=1 Tax=Bosea vestrisii TaxID=151416 RepID=UPI0024E022B7|nr:hypothetical protein [Bosea vestrisii]WID96247.1 hypothetical protein QO058_26555 [Bosea vestrisii]
MILVDTKRGRAAVAFRLPERPGGTVALINIIHHRRIPGKSAAASGALQGERPRGVARVL